jgi:LmbE family N-acetylglucosaminyl deacetylase
MSIIYLSPHMDDAVLSCGGAIHQRTTAGEPVKVITLFAHDVCQGTTLSAFALEQHAYWGNVPRPMALRRAEDKAALTLLGADALHLAYHDAVYRVGSSEEWLYPDLQRLFGGVNEADPLGLDGAREIADRLVSLIGPRDSQVVFAPLGVGKHVDHVITHLAARRLESLGYRLAYYEDYPYAERSGAVESALDAAGAKDWSTRTIRLEPADVAAKVSALSFYRSQLAVLFGGAEAMPNRVWSFASTRTAGACLSERAWWPK